MNQLIDNSTTFVPGDRVLALTIDSLGTIKKVRYDSAGKAIYTIFTDDPLASADGVYYARECEISKIDKPLAGKSA